MLQQAQDRSFLATAQSRMREWNDLVRRVAATERSPLRPQMAIAALGEALAPDAVISLDCGANTHFAARCLMLKEGQRLTGTGLLATMGPDCHTPSPLPSRIRDVNRQRSSATAASRCS